MKPTPMTGNTKMNEDLYQMYKLTKNLIRSSEQCECHVEHAEEQLFKDWKSAIATLDKSSPVYKERYENDLICGEKENERKN